MEVSLLHYLVIFCASVKLLQYEDFMLMPDRSLKRDSILKDPFVSALQRNVVCTQWNSTTERDKQSG